MSGQPVAPRDAPTSGAPLRCSASSGGKPRSRKTFPVERVIFTLIGGLPAFLRALFQERSEALPRHLQVSLRGSLRAFIECVENG
jgi:hypothetical protein